MVASVKAPHISAFVSFYRVRVLAINPLVLSFDPLVLSIDPLVLSIDPLVMSIDPLVLSIDPLVLSIPTAYYPTGAVFTRLFTFLFLLPNKVVYLPTRVFY